MKTLDELIKGINVSSFKGPSNPSVDEICFDTRNLRKNSLFAALKGVNSDAAEFIDKAVEGGAVAILCENLPKNISPEITYIEVKDSHEALGIAAANFYDNPSSRINLIGITGTNGKTTCATLLYRLFRKLGYKCGLISTIENRIEEEIIPSTHTTPDPLALNSLISRMVNTGCKYVFMEVSSHAIAQKRIAGLKFTGGIFTNISHDHLDYHKTFDEYIKVKKAFFDSLPSNAFALTNIDDKRGKVMLQNTHAKHYTYSLNSASDFNAKILEIHFSGMLLSVDQNEVWVKLIGKFNAYNILCAYAAAFIIEEDKTKILETLSSIQSPAGRFDYMIASNKTVGIVDYAHTPDAVENLISTVCDIKTKEQKIITIIGCGGDRDKTKRPLMAKVSCKWSDRVVLTSDNPRSEDPEQIIKEMETGLKSEEKLKTLSIVDRREAIKAACLLSNPGDIILLLGKGHEKYQEINSHRHHFDDKEELLKQFKYL